jgi:hypothetical protein
VSSAQLSGDPEDLDRITSLAEFTAALERLWARKGSPSVREIEYLSAEARAPISFRSAASLLRGETKPRRGTVDGFLRGVGADNEERVAYLAVWDRLQAPQPTPAEPAADRPGPPAGSVLTHDDLTRKLSAENLYGTGMQVPFLSPGKGHSADPAQVLCDLKSCDDQVVLLVGRAGAGKTRTCMEVANLAQDDGWRVLHVVAGPRTARRDLKGTVLRDPTARTLLVVDNADRCQRVDLWRFLHEVGATVAYQGGELRLLAATRPSLVGQVPVTGTNPLHRIALRADRDHDEALVARIFDAVAPGANEKLGADRLAVLCSRRPVIALLLAQDREQLFLPGDDHPLDHGRRTLIWWLRHRLQENDLLPEKSREKQVSRMALASALAAATCPAPPDDVVAALRALFAEGEKGDVRAVEVVEQLEDMDWLELSGGEYRVVHDIVTDELLSGVLLTPGGQLIDKETLRGLLDCLLDHPTALDRFAGNLARMHADLRPVPYRQVAEVCDAWLARNASRLGQSFADRPGTAQVIYTMLHTELWRRPVLTSWATLVEPMLRQHAATGSAELAAALRDRVVPHRVLTSALIWLARHRTEPDAEEVLVPLLRHANLTAEQRAALAGHAIEWVKATRAENDATLVLRLLIERPPASERLTDAVVDAAFSWLARNPEAPTADFALRPLLSHTPLDGTRLLPVARAALRWLDGYATSLRASHLLKQLIIRYGKLPPDYADRTLTLVWRWLDRHGRRTEATFLLGPLLRQRLAGEEATATALRFSEAWLTANVSSPHASFVLRRMLAVRGLRADRLEHYLRQALAWLAECGPAVDTSFVLREIVVQCQRKPGLPCELVDEVHARARAWLAAHTGEPRAGYVLSALLTSRKLGSVVRAELGGEGVTWLRETPGADDCRPRMLEALLRLPSLDRGSVPEVMDAALDWLAGGGEEGGTSRVLSALLDRARITGVRVDRVTAVARRWLTDHPDRPSSPFVLAAAVRHGPGADPGGDIRDRAMAWLTDHPASWRTPRVVYALIQRHDLDGEQRRSLFEGLLARTNVRPGTRSTLYALRTVLECPTVDPRHAGPAVHGVLAFIENSPDRPEVVPLIRAMIGCRAVGGGLGDSVVAGTVRWLLDHRHHPDAPDLVRELIRMCAPADVGADRTDQALHAAMELAGDHADDRWAPLIFESMLGVPGIGPDRARQVAARVTEWLAANPGHAAVPDALVVLLREPGGAAADSARAAVDWLTRNPDGTSARRLLRALLDTAGLDPAGARAIVGSALSWMAARPGQPRVPYLLAALLTDLSPVASAAAAAGADELLSRLADHVAGHAAPDLFRMIGSSPWLEPGHRECAAEVALRWLDTEPGGAGASDLLAVVVGKLRLPAEVRARAAALALDRLDRQPDDPTAPGLIRAVLGGAPAGAADASRAVLRAFAWLRRNPASPAVPELLRTLTGSTALTPEEFAQAVTETVGWLEARPGVPAAELLRSLAGNRRVPDAYADRILEVVLTRLDRAGGEDAGETPDLLRAAANSSRLDGTAVDRLVEVAVPWLARHTDHPAAPDVVATLAAHTRPGGPLAGALRGWLRRQRPDEATPTLLGRLTAAPRDIAEEAAEIGFGWLGEHDEHPAAPDLLARIAGSVTVVPATAARAARLALAWAVRHPSDAAVPRLLQRLSTTPSAATADRAVAAAIDWAERNPDDPQVPDLLRCVAGGRSVTAAAADRAATAALDWAERHAADPAGPALLLMLSLNTRMSTRCADLVLCTLLRRADEFARPDLLRFLAVGTKVSSPVADRAAALALDWITGDDPQTPVLLGHLVNGRCLSPETMSRVVAEAQRWLGAHGAQPAAVELRQRLVRAAGLGEAARRVARDALAWAARQAAHPAVPRLLGGLLDGVRSADFPVDDLVTGALGWLEGHPDASAAAGLYEKLLQLGGEASAPIAREMVEATVAWLDDHRTHPVAALPLAQLLLRPGAGQTSALARVEGWLAACGSMPRAKNVLICLLHGPARSAFTTDVAVRWLTAHPDHPGGGDVAAHLLRSELPPDRLREVLLLALDWLDAHLADETGMQLLLSELLRCAAHPPGTAARSVESALTWLSQPRWDPARPEDRGLAAVVLSLLCAPALGAERELEACQAALRWLGPIAMAAPELVAPPSDFDRRSLARHLTENFATRFPPAALEFAQAWLSATPAPATPS